MSRTGKALLFLVWVALMAWGVTGVYQRFTQGHILANYGSYVPWGLWVSAYIYFIGLSAGAFLLSSMIYVFGLHRLERIGRLSLFTSAVTLLMALLSIWFDLGHLERFYEVFTRPSFSSMMTWMVWLYTGYFALILAELWFSLRPAVAAQAQEKGRVSWVSRLFGISEAHAESGQTHATSYEHSRRMLRILGAIGIPLAIAFHGGVGALSATLSARPYWHTGLYPILFLTGALTSGGALMLAVVAIFHRESSQEQKDLLKFLSRLVLGILLFDLLLEWAEFSTPMWYRIGQEHGLMKEILFGQYWYVFWIFHMALGSIIPILLLIWKPVSRWAVGIGGGLIAVTFLTVRLNIVIPGLITPTLRGLENSYVDHRLVFQYAPSWFEWSVVAFIVALGGAIFYIGSRILPLAQIREREA